MKSAANSVSSAIDQPRARIAITSVLCFLLALAFRIPKLNQSLWCDEMSTYLDYIQAPWPKILAGGAGDYVPNNHVLFTVLAKVVCGFFSVGQVGMVAVNESLIRLPSLIAGAMLPIAVSWPLRNRFPFIAVIMALLLTIHPWLIAFSVEARGYSLMLLLGVLATNLLPDGHLRWPILYAVMIGATLYTVPVALLLLLAHGVYVCIFNRFATSAWLRGCLLALILTTALYLPMSRGLWAYYQHPLPGPDNYADFLNKLPRFAVAGQYLPRPIDLLVDTPSPSIGIVYLIVPAVLTLIGSMLGWRSPAFRKSMIVFGGATLIGMMLGLFMHSAAQVRFVPWCALWMCFSVAGILAAIRARFGWLAMAAAFLLPCTWLIFCDTTLLPSQPIRDALVQADANTPPGTPIVAALLTAPQAVALYHSGVTHHQLVAAAAIPQFMQLESQCIQSTGHRPAVVMSYEYLLRDLQPGFWNYINQHYKLAARLPGRISPVSIYEPSAGL